MIARIAGASLGLFAFAIVTISGLIVQNPMTVTLSRALFALFTFLIVGLILGGAAQLIVDEHRKEAGAGLDRRAGAERIDTAKRDETDQPSIKEVGGVAG